MIARCLLLLRCLLPLRYLLLRRLLLLRSPPLLRCLPLLALIAAHSPVASAARANPAAKEDQFRAWRYGATQALIARADANSLATAAALSFVGAKTESAKADPSKTDAAKTALDLAARASELAPQNPGIGWLHLRLCADTPSCDIRDVATVMRWVDADNGAAWLPTLAAAEKDKDATEVDRVLADMARGKRFDLYFNRVVVLMFDALAGARNELPGGYATSDAGRFATVDGIATGEIIPPFSPLIDACREPAAVADRREQCLKLSKTMQRGDTIIAQMAGFSIERRLLAPDSKEARAIGERRHVLEWRVTEASKFDAPLLPWLKNARARARLAQMRSLPREEDVCIAILKQHKMAIAPPEPHT
jgi:hypothetical protein